MQLHITLNCPNPIHAALSGLLESYDIANEQNFGQPGRITIVPQAIHNGPHRPIADIAAACPSKEKYKVVKWRQSQELSQIDFAKVFEAKDIGFFCFKNHQALISSDEGAQEEKGLTSNVRGNDDSYRQALEEVKDLPRVPDGSSHLVEGCVVQNDQDH